MPIFVITGASGGGKSAILQELAERGFRTQPEIGRALVKQQLEIDGHALPGHSERGQVLKLAQ